MLLFEVAEQHLQSNKLSLHDVYAKKIRYDFVIFEIDANVSVRGTFVGLLEVFKVEVVILGAEFVCFLINITNHSRENIKDHTIIL